MFFLILDPFLDQGPMPLKFICVTLLFTAMLTAIYDYWFDFSTLAEEEGILCLLFWF